jgi:hypothetical protein
MVNHYNSTFAKPIFMRIYWILLIIIVFVGCQSDQKNIRDYYFPLKALTGGLVYEYRAVNNDTLAPDYWYYRSFVTDTSVYLAATYYDAATLTPLQLVREEMFSNGMAAQDLYLYETDSTGKQRQIIANIESGSVFPFEVRDSGGIFLYKVSWQMQDATTTLIKNRRYTGDTTFVFQEKTYDCVVFEVKELLEHDQEGFFEQEFDGVEWYAKGLGLVYSKKTITPTFILEYRLANRYPMERLEALFKKSLSDQATQ